MAASVTRDVGEFLKIGQGFVDSLLSQHREDLVAFTARQAGLRKLLLNIAKTFYTDHRRFKPELNSLLRGRGVECAEELLPGPDFEFPVQGRGQCLINKAHALEWAKEQLKDRSLGAVDGSQLLPSMLHNLPLGFASTGWYLNHHGSRGFVQESSMELVVPGEGGRLSEEKVNFKRTFLELKKILELVEELGHEDRKPGRMPLIFFDGSLIFSFAEHIQPREQEAYRGILQEILQCSGELHVPVVGYVDTSQARDIGTTLLAFRELLLKHGEPDPAGLGENNCEILQSQNLIPDSLLLAPGLLRFGDRSPAFSCRRMGLLRSAAEESRINQVHLLYLRTGARFLPGRLEFPAWITEMGKVQELTNIVLAQCIPGFGYPKVLTRAHQLAVISSSNREFILCSLSRFLEENGIELQFSSKSVMKEK